MAERFADDERGEYRPRLTEWSAQEQLLAGLFDRLGDVVAAVVASGGDKPPTLDGWPRPETALDRVTRRRTQQQYEALVQLVEASKRR